MSKFNIQENLLYRDGLILVINKPPGLPVHAGPKGGDNLEKYFDELTFGLSNLPALGHRLDRDTSGCLILGRHKKALRRIGRLFTNKLIQKTYWAIVVGKPEKKSGRIDLPLKKRTDDKRSWWMCVDPEGQKAITDYKVIGHYEDLTWLELSPRTGKTHQIRVHCAELGCPVLGDPIYGKDVSKSDQYHLHLHARALKIPLYQRKPTIEVEADPAPHMQKTLKNFRM